MMADQSKTVDRYSEIAYAAGLFGAMLAGERTKQGSGAKLFSTPGTFSWTPPDGVAEITVTAAGAGGGGSGMQHSSGGYAGWGGGAGAMLVKKTFSVEPGTSLTLMVGEGGHGRDGDGGAAGSGGPTSILGLFLLKGGRGAPVPYNDDYDETGGAKSTDWEEEIAGPSGHHGIRILTDTFGDVVIGGPGGAGLFGVSGSIFGSLDAYLGSGGRGGDGVVGDRGADGGNGFILIEWQMPEGGVDNG